MLSHHPGCPRAPAINVVDRTMPASERKWLFFLKAVPGKAIQQHWIRGIRGMGGWKDSLAWWLPHGCFFRRTFLDLWMCAHTLEEIISAFKSPVRTLFYPCSCCPGPKKPQCRTADFARSRNASTYMSLHMNWQAAKGFNGYAMQHQNDSKYMYVLTHVWLGKLCSPRLNMVIWPMLFSKVLVRIHETFF